MLIWDQAPRLEKNDDRSNANIFRESTKKKGSETLKEDKQKPEMKKNEEDEHAWRKSSTTHNNDIKIPTLVRRPPMPRYHNFFLGLCYACNNYGKEHL